MLIVLYYVITFHCVLLLIYLYIWRIWYRAVVRAKLREIADSALQVAVVDGSLMVKERNGETLRCFVKEKRE
jgi:hypothetical protein